MSDNNTPRRAGEPVAWDLATVDAVAAKLRKLAGSTRKFHEISYTLRERYREDARDLLSVVAHPPRVRQGGRVSKDVLKRYSTLRVNKMAPSQFVEVQRMAADFAAAEETIAQREKAIDTHEKMLASLLDTNAVADDFANVLSPEWFEIAESIESLRDQMGVEVALRGAAERERDEARREREDYKAMYLDLWDAAKRHETEREALRHRAERAERVVEALREPSDAVIDALRTHIYQYALTNSLDMAHGLRAAVEAADCATPTPEPTP